MARLDELTDPQFEDFLSSIYLTMLRLGQPTRDGLVETGLHPGDVDRAAQFLVSRELITEASAGSWEILPPETALPRLASALEERARTTRSTASELSALWQQARYEPGQNAFLGVEMLTSVDEIVLAAYALAATAQERIRIFLDGSPAALRIVLDATERAPRPAVGPGAISMVVDVALFEHEGVLPSLEAAVSAGQKIRVADGLPFSGMVVDDKAGLVDLSSHDERADGSFLVRRRAPAAALAALFEVAYELATPLGPTLQRVAGGEDAPLDDRDRRILGWLATGASDQQIARHLGVSTRTVERRVAALMNVLGSATRFQSGVQAARRGWI